MKAEERIIRWRCINCAQSGELEVAQSDDCSTIWRRIVREHTGCKLEAPIAIEAAQRARAKS